MNDHAACIPILIALMKFLLHVGQQQRQRRLLSAAGIWALGLEGKRGMLGPRFDLQYIAYTTANFDVNNNPSNVPLCNCLIALLLFRWPKVLDALMIRSSMNEVRFWCYGNNTCVRTQRAIEASIPEISWFDLLFWLTSVIRIKIWKNFSLLLRWIYIQDTK